jgi:hypothetical protein
LGYQVHPIIQILFPNDSVFQYDVTVPQSIQSWFKEHEGELQYLPWPAQQSSFNIIEPPWSVLKSKSEEQVPALNSSKAAGRYSMKRER